MYVCFKKFTFMPISSFPQWEKSPAAGFHLLTYRTARTGHNPTGVQRWFFEETKARNNYQI